LDVGQVILPDEFARAREDLARELRRSGLLSGDRVLVAVSNGPMFVATLTAILACEGSPLLVHFKAPPAELRRYAQRFGVRFLACEPATEEESLEVAQRSVDLKVGKLSTLRWGVMPGADQATIGPVLRGVPLHPTSGSTGLPKVALRPGFAAIEEARHYAETMSVDARDGIVAIPPMSHAYGYGVCVMVPLLTGANIISIRRFNAKLVFRAIQEHPATIVPAVPAMLSVLSLGARQHWRNLRFVLTAGSILPQRAAEQFRKVTGVVPCPLYGTTETGGISVATAADGRDVSGRVGRPMEGVSVDVRGSESLRDLQPGEGRHHVKSSSMMSGYLDDQGNITRPFDDDGWFETGDLARIDEDGTINLRGRSSDVINVSGFKVVPCEVEETISVLPGVVEVKVYGGPLRNEAEVVKAAVVTENGLSMPDIRAHCERHLVYYKRPQVITLLDALPRTPTGKIIPSELP
jgi:acyl-CoA synthetase (AMP-forming)/AMP-acid ligase II